MASFIDVFIVDDSAVVRNILTKLLGSARSIRVVGSAADPFQARKLLAETHVDVILLDIEMPKMDGLTFLKYLMKYYPIPTIVLSSLASEGSQAAFSALELGAVDVLPKPGGPYSVTEIVEQLVERIIIAANIPKHKLGRSGQGGGNGRPSQSHKHVLATIQTTRSLVTVGASTGGTSAMERIFRDLPGDFPALLAVIHMPERFTKSFAKRLDDLCEMRVKEAEHEEIPVSGTIYIAPGNKHLSVRASGATLMLETLDGPRVHNQRPAVDVTFRSVARCLGQNAIGALLTGMGKDGAEGLLAMRQAGAYTIIQDEESCIVYGMPKAALDLGAASIQLPLDMVAGEMVQQLNRKRQ